MIDEEYRKIWREYAESLVDSSFEEPMKEGYSLDDDARKLLVGLFEEFSINLWGAIFELALRKGHSSEAPEKDIGLGHVMGAPKYLVDTEHVQEIDNDEKLMAELMDKAYEIAKLRLEKD